MAWGAKSPLQAQNHSAYVSLTLPNARPPFLELLGPLVHGVPSHAGELLTPKGEDVSKLARVRHRRGQGAASVECGDQPWVRSRSNDHRLSVRQGVQLLPHIPQYWNKDESYDADDRIRNRKIGLPIGKRYPPSHSSVTTDGDRKDVVRCTGRFSVAVPGGTSPSGGYKRSLCTLVHQILNRCG